ncbi:MAG: dihydropteroate synthase [Lachnospiraceae bacterium]|nr:dihydropteroate synthase [Lachnospiraceae bacterium]
MKIGSREFDVKHHTYVVGILNVTPDSFSDGGKFDTLDKAMEHVERMIAEGADMIDVGGESTRPGYQPVSVKEEIERVLPIIRKIKMTYDVPISLDTWKPEVAGAALAAGVDMINDISCMKEREMAALVAESGCAYCLMHNRDGLIEAGSMVKEDLAAALETAWQAGVRTEQVMIDPGIGFAKTYEQNLVILNRIEELHCFGLPILIGVSRKSVIGYALDLPVEERLEGTLATTAYAVMKRCAFVRVHDVKENVRVVKMIESIVNVS